MSAALDAGAAMRGGACMELPAEVVDKYFFADADTEPFEYYTAKAICGRCAVRAACLTDAIGSTAVFAGSVEMIRAGESGGMIKNLRRRHFLNGEPVAQLAATVLEHQKTMRTVGDFRHLRQGKFPDAQLIGADDEW